MKTNAGGVDRTLRVALGLALLAWLFVADVGLGWLGAIGMVPLATGLAGFCPLYKLLGVHTCALSDNNT